MSYTKKIVCLANSRKPPSGRCIAGRELISERFGTWIRPVSTRETREISEEERRYEDGTDPKVLDIIKIEMMQSVPQGHQKENHLIDHNYYWVKKGSISWDDLQRAVENLAGPLWINGYSTSYGFNDRIPENLLSQVDRSLYLVRPNTMSLMIAAEGDTFGSPRRRVRAQFDLHGHSYNIVVTDPWIEKKYLANPDGETKLKDVVLCVSLGEIFNGYSYKLAASVITAKRAES